MAYLFEISEEVKHAKIRFENKPMFSPLGAAEREVASLRDRLADAQQVIVGLMEKIDRLEKRPTPPDRVEKLFGARKGEV